MSFKKITAPAVDGFRAVSSGLDASVGNIASDPTFKTIAEFGRDFTIEALPGDQRTGLDQSYGEGMIKTGVALRDTGLVNTGIKRHTQKHAGSLRETAAEKTLGAGLRKAGTVLAKRIPAMASKVAAGTAGSAGALAIPMGVWAAADTLDTAVQAATGRTILEHAEDPNRIRGRYGAKHGL